MYTFSLIDVEQRSMSRNAGSRSYRTSYLSLNEVYLRNNSWKPYCVVSCNMGWQDISRKFYPSLQPRINY